MPCANWTATKVLKTQIAVQKKSTLQTKTFPDPRATCSNGKNVPGGYLVNNGSKMLKPYVGDDRATMVSSMRHCYAEGARVFEPRTLRESILYSEMARGIP